MAKSNGAGLSKKYKYSRAVLAHACNPSTLGGRSRRMSEFEASLVYRVSSRTSRAIQRNPVSKKPNPKTKQNKIIFYFVYVYVGLYSVGKWVSVLVVREITPEKTWCQAS